MWGWSSRQCGELPGTLRSIRDLLIQAHEFYSHIIDVGRSIVHSSRNSNIPEKLHRHTNVHINIRSTQRLLRPTFYATRLVIQVAPCCRSIHGPQIPFTGFLIAANMVLVTPTPKTVKAPRLLTTGVGRRVITPPRLFQGSHELRSQALWCTALSRPSAIRSILDGPQDTASMVWKRPSKVSRRDRVPSPRFTAVTQ